MNTTLWITVLYQIVVLAGVVSLTSGLFKVIDAIERPRRRK